MSVMASVWAPWGCRYDEKRSVCCRLYEEHLYLGINVVLWSVAGEFGRKMSLKIQSFHRLISSLMPSEVIVALTCHCKVTPHESGVRGRLGWATQEPVTRGPPLSDSWRMQASRVAPTDTCSRV
jgi:hypothetical protein